MTGRQPRDWIPIHGLNDEQVAFLTENAIDWLITKAADLPAPSDDDDWKNQAEEIAALGRLVGGLRHGKILAGDEVARKLAARTISETNTLDELREEYRRELAEHEAWAALLARFDTAHRGDT